MSKGWAMDDQRLKDGSSITEEYFEHQLVRTTLATAPRLASLGGYH